MKKAHFEWNEDKKRLNHLKHGVYFSDAQNAFLDPKRVIAEDVNHSQQEKRYYCFGNVESEVMTVRFTYRDNIIRIIGAGYWRKGRSIYEKANS